MNTTTFSTKDKIALIAISLSSMMFGLEISSVPVILPTLEKVLHSDFKSMQWIMNAYTIACTTVLMAVGTLADRYGRRFIFMISLMLFGITSLLCGITQSTSVLIISRFLQGIGGGAMLICQIATLSQQFREGAARGKAFAVWGIIFGIGLGFGPIIGGAILAISNWHWVFLVHFPLSIITLILVFSSVQESRDPNAKRLDIFGILTLSLSVFGLTYFITQGPDMGFTSIPALAILAVTITSFLVFLSIERTHSYPMFDFSVFKVRNFSGALVGSVGMNFSFWPLMIYLPLYFQNVLGYDTITAGSSLLAYTLPALITPPLAEKLSLRYRPGIIIPLGLFTIGLGLLLMCYGSTMEHASWLTMLPGCIIAGTGLGFTNTPVSNTTTASVSAERAGMASGIDTSARLITLAINIAIMGFVLLAGILAYVTKTLPGKFSGTQLHALAENIATGNFTALSQRFPELATTNIARSALAHGLNGVMLYGGIGVWVLSLVSFITFGPQKTAKTGKPTLVPEEISS